MVESGDNARIPSWRVKQHTNTHKELADYGIEGKPDVICPCDYPKVRLECKEGSRLRLA